MNPHLINNLLNNIISLLLDGNIKIKIWRIYDQSTSIETSL
jgi:hypothetical protein